MMKSCFLINFSGGHHHDFTFIPHNLCMFFIVTIAVFFMHEKNPVTKQGSKKKFLKQTSKSLHLYTEFHVQSDAVNLALYTLATLLNCSHPTPRETT